MFETVHILYFERVEYLYKMDEILNKSHVKIQSNHGYEFGRTLHEYVKRNQFAMRFIDIIHAEQHRYVDKMVIDSGIARNQSLREVSKPLPCYSM